MSASERYKKKLEKQIDDEKRASALAKLLKSQPEEESSLYLPVESEPNGGFKTACVTEGEMVNSGIWSNSPVWSPGIYFHGDGQKQIEEAVGCGDCSVNGGRGGMLRVINCEPNSELLLASSTDNDRVWEVMLACRGRSNLVEQSKSTKENERDTAIGALARLPCSRGRIEANLKMRR